MQYRNRVRTRETRPIACDITMDEGGLIVQPYYSSGRVLRTPNHKNLRLPVWGLGEEPQAGCSEVGGG